jgi:hypothetical protein
MDSILKSNGNRTDHSVGFTKGQTGKPDKNPYEVDLGNGEKEDLTWLIK